MEQIHIFIFKVYWKIWCLSTHPAHKDSLQKKSIEKYRNSMNQNVLYVRWCKCFFFSPSPHNHRELLGSMWLIIKTYWLLSFNTMRYIVLVIIWQVLHWVNEEQIHNGSTIFAVVCCRSSSFDCECIFPKGDQQALTRISLCVLGILSFHIFTTDIKYKETSHNWKYSIVLIFWTRSPKVESSLLLNAKSSLAL